MIAVAAVACARADSTPPDHGDVDASANAGRAGSGGGQRAGIAGEGGRSGGASTPPSDYNVVAGAAGAAGAPGAGGAAGEGGATSGGAGNLPNPRSSAGGGPSGGAAGSEQAGAAGAGGVESTGRDGAAGSPAHARGGADRGGSAGGREGGAGAGGSSCDAALVINEISTSGTTSADEYVEILNKGSCVVNLEDWTLKYSSASGSTPSMHWKGKPTDALAPGAYMVIAGAGFAGDKQGSLSSGFASGGGAVGLFAPGANAPADAVAWAAALASNPLCEGTPCGTIPAGKAAARIPNGADTGDNSVDFVSDAPRTPGAPNQ